MKKKILMCYCLLTVFAMAFTVTASGSGLYGTFTGAGVWQWDGTTWTQATPNNPDLIVTTSTTLYGSFAGGGIWKWDGSSWSQATSNNPQLMVISGSDLYGSFAGGGIWKWNGSAWSQVTPNSPDLMVMNSGSNLYGSFAGAGIWKWDGSNWSQVTPNNPQLMSATGSLLYGSFPGGGIWRWNGTTWTEITPNNPQLMVVSGSNLFGSFAGGGIWKWDGTNWIQVTPNNPQMMSATGSLLYGSFAGGGIWKWDGSVWSQVTPNNPETMVAGSPSGSLDTTFGTGGIVTTSLGSHDDYAYALGIQSDGKLVAAGYSNNGSNLDFALVRYNADGSLDTTFGTGGKVTTSVGSSDDAAYGLGIQSDGKLVAAGYSNNGSNADFALVRYNADGGLDTTFGAGGKVTTAIGSSNNYARALGIQSDGKLVAAGYSNNGSNLDFALVRYNADGSLDTTFGTGGKVTTSVGSSDDAAYALGIQSDGKIVAAGQYLNGSYYDFALVRYNTNGSLDTTFGTGGKVTTAIRSSNDVARTLGIQSDGKIVAAGFSQKYGYNYDFALVRYNADGSLDTAFGTGGKVITPVGSSSAIAYALGIQSDGRIVAAGDYANGSNADFALVRYNADGSLDTTFGTGGKVTTPVGSSSSNANALGIQSDGRIVAAGYSNNGSNNDFALVRY